MNKFDDLSSAPMDAVDVKGLRLLTALIETGSVSSAAARLGMSQSTASYGLEKLRQAFGDPIVVRSGRGVAPTARGELIAAESAAALARLDRVAAPQAFDPASTTRRFKIAASAFERDAVVAGLWSRVQAAAPNARIELRGMDRGQVAAQLGVEVDVAFIAYPPDRADLKQRKLLDDAYVTFFDADARAAPSTLEAFCAAPHAIATLGGRMDTVVDERLRALGRSRRIQISTDGFEALPALMRGGQAITTIPRRFGDALFRGFAHVPCPLELPTVSVTALWSVRDDLDPGHRWLRDRIAEVEPKKT